MSLRHTAARRLRSNRARATLGISAAGVALALGGVFTAQAASASAETSGPQTHEHSTETDVPPDAKPAQTAAPCPGGAPVCAVASATQAH
ncbi:hypothetical protein [Streptomyces griseorubiginosus]|uniref:hypothetical protein n=1 Tax=Streptomyces griseorubiginosus TaxID=67304 RepID=UPI0036EA4DB7